MHRDLRKEHGKHRARYANDFVAGLLLTSRAVFRFDAQRTTVQRAAGRDPHVERESRPPYTTPVIEEPSRRAWSRAARCAAAWRLAASGSVQRRARKPSPNCLAHCFSRRKPAVGVTKGGHAALCIRGRPWHRPMTGKRVTTEPWTSCRRCKQKIRRRVRSAPTRATSAGHREEVVDGCGVAGYSDAWDSHH
jgi:hypothetical protein